MDAHLEETFLCQKSWPQHPSPACMAWGCIVSPLHPARSRRHGSGKAFWWRCPLGWHGPAHLSPDGQGACAWHGAGDRTRWARLGGNKHSACCLSCTGCNDPGAVVGRFGSLQSDWPLCCASAFLHSRSWSSFGRKLERRELSELCKWRNNAKCIITVLHYYC